MEYTKNQLEAALAKAQLNPEKHGKHIKTLQYTK